MKENPRKATVPQILVTFAALVVVIAGMRAAAVILVPFLLAAFIAIISTPPMFWLRRKGLPAWLSLFIVMIVVALMGLLISGLVGSSIKVFSKELPIYEAKLRQYVAVMIAWVEKLGVDTSGIEWTNILDPGAAMKLVATGLNSLGKILTNGFLILMTVVFMLIEASSLPIKLRTILGDTADVLINFEKFINSVKHYMAIKTLVSFATGIVITVWLAVIGVDFPVLWGLLAFLLNYVPNIGSIIAAIPAVLLAFVQLGMMKALIAAAGYVVVNLVMGSVIEPRYMGRGLGLSTLVVFLSLIFWGWVLGPVGMLLSVPLTMTAKIALDTRQETRWLSILLGPDIVPKRTDEAEGGETPDTG